jgi:acyl carrier protein
VHEYADIRKEMGMGITDGVRDVLREALELGNRADEFDSSTPLFESLIELDSMAVVTVVVALEEHFDIQIEDDEIGADTFETFGNLTSFVESKVAS